jgi:hypothetical protein
MSELTNPYESQPLCAFWKTAVAGRDPIAIDGLWTPKFVFGKYDPIATLGSCFAQHISRALVVEGYNWINAEPAPHRFSAADKAKYQYEVFSARTANIYTVAMLRQWMHWAFGNTPVPCETWLHGDRFYDPFRPTIEPNGFCGPEELLALRRQTLAAIRAMFEQCSVFVFTLGLTEAWLNRDGGYVYAMCPGTAAGVYDADKHMFKNHDMFEIHADLVEVLRLLRSVNSRARVLLTVSPVPLTATASTDHVLTATIRSKSILRAVAASIAAKFDHVDYFPSYEIISSFPYRGDFYEPNMRTVSAEGVAHVMKTFLRALDGAPEYVPVAGAPGAEAKQESRPGEPEVDAVCEEMMLESYAPVT